MAANQGKNTTLGSSRTQKNKRFEAAEKGEEFQKFLEWTGEFSKTLKNRKELSAAKKNWETNNETILENNKRA